MKAIADVLEMLERWQLPTPDHSVHQVLDIVQAAGGEGDADESEVRYSLSGGCAASRVKAGSWSDRCRGR